MTRLTLLFQPDPSSPGWHRPHSLGARSPTRVSPALTLAGSPHSCSPTSHAGGVRRPPVAGLMICRNSCRVSRKGTRKMAVLGTHLQ